MPAELPLVPSAIALASSALLFFAPGRSRLAHRSATLLVALGALLPIALDPLVDPERAAGRALWQWSAVGGPLVQASYRLDELAVVALSVAVLFAGAAMAAASRVDRRHPALAALILAVGLVTIALVVTDDLVAAIVVLAVLAAVTTLALFAVAPVAATARAAAYLSLGLQAWVLAALLMSQSGSPTFTLGSIPPQAVNAGVMLAATLGALLYAGLYPVVSWSVDGSDAARDLGPLGSLVLMPAGVGATFLLIRVLGASDAAPTVIALPVLAAAILTVAYAGVVSLALPEHWETVRSHLALVAMWTGIATGSPLAMAGGVVALFARAAAAIATSLWLVPHRDYAARIGGSAVYLTGVVAVGVGGVGGGSEPALAALAGVAVILLIALEAAQLMRPLGMAGVVMPRLEAVAERARPVMRALDPAPLGVGLFRAIELAATRASVAFATFERRAGVWLATAVIVAVLVWVAR